jgi:hypothetical protein
MNSNDNYYLRRIEEELGAAERASDPAVAMIHRELAERYRAILQNRVALAPRREVETMAARFNGA